MSTADRVVCNAVQLAIIAGDVLDESQQRHRDGCPECRFVVELSRHFSGFGASSSASDVFGPGVTAGFAYAVASGEPVLGRYRIEALCGRGGQGVVYRAVDLETDERIALKLVRVTSDAAEIRNARKIRHPNVCGVYHTERYGDLRLISMEWIDGPTLSRRERAGRRETLEIVRQICAGVAAVHAEGVLHLDLKPSNVLFRGAEPVIADFGLSVREVAGVIHAAGGTKHYMAPEQRNGQPVDRRTDVYALGRLAEDLLIRPSRRVRRVMRRATDADPGRRYPDAETFAKALLPRRRPAVIAIAIAAALVLLTTALLVVPPPQGPRAIWDPSRWGPDTIPAQAWNVARNPIGEGLPRVDVEHPMWGCAQHPYDLLDGVSEYENWEHGVAFLPVPNTAHPDHECVSLHLMGACGTLHADDELCEFDDPSAQAGFHKIKAHGRDVAAMSAERRARVGVAVATRPCGERAMTIHLEAVYPVFALRVWHHNAMNTPHFFKIELRDQHGELHVAVTANNEQGMTAREQESSRTYGSSAPVTTRFAPVMTREIRYIINTCSTGDTSEVSYLHGAVPGDHPLPRSDGHGWIYEVEVFAMVPRWRAWWRFLHGA